jgi:multidrug transporter EmrE-like cation transporter
MNDDRKPVVAENSEPELISVWNETVKTKNLFTALLISVPLTLIGLLVADKLLTGVMDDDDIAKTYSLLIGLAIVVITAVVNAKLFRPQRIVTTETPGESTTFEETLRDLEVEPGGLGDTSAVPSEVRQEMRDLGLYEAFVEAEQRSSRDEGIK